MVANRIARRCGLRLLAASPLAILLPVLHASTTPSDASGHLAASLSQAIANSLAYPAKPLLYTYIFMMLIFGGLIGLLSILPSGGPRGWKVSSRSRRALRRCWGWAADFGILSRHRRRSAP
jgi:hypothetical protein